MNVQKIIDACPDPELRLMFVLLSHGMRLGDSLALTWSDVELLSQWRPSRYHRIAAPARRLGGSGWVASIWSWIRRTWLRSFGA